MLILYLPVTPGARNILHNCGHILIFRIILTEQYIKSGLRQAQAAFQTTINGMGHTLVFSL